MRAARTARICAWTVLPIRKVVVYRNGVGYFERSGEVDGESVQFRMRQRMVGDFLATLAIVERGGSSVQAASFPLDVSTDDPTAPDPQFMRMLAAWDNPDQVQDSRNNGRNKLRDVTLRLDGNSTISPWVSGSHAGLAAFVSDRRAGRRCRFASVGDRRERFG